MLRDLLNAEGVEIGRLHVATLMKRMGIEAIYRKPNTSKRAPGHKIYPYLLRKTKVARSDHVWAMDITYIPMARGFVYLGRRRRLVQQARAFSSRVDHDGGRLLRRSAGGGSGEIRAAGDLQHRSRLAIHRRGLHRRPSQGRRRHQHGRQGLLARQCLLSKGSGDPVKYEEVYLRAYRTVMEARASIASYLRFYNSRRPHSSLDRQTPDQAYFNRLPQIAAP